MLEKKFSSHSFLDKSVYFWIAVTFLRKVLYINVRELLKTVSFTQYVYRKLFKSFETCMTYFVPMFFLLSPVNIYQSQQ